MNINSCYDNNIKELFCWTVLIYERGNSYYESNVITTNGWKDRRGN